MPRILFIQPTQYGGDRKLCKQKKIHLPGLVFPLLAAMTPANWDVELVIEVVDNVDYDTDADIVGIGTMGYTIFRGLEIAKEFRIRGKLVIMGGYMASMVVNKIIDEVDSILIGDVEKSYPVMLKDFEDKGTLRKIYDMPVNDLVGLPIPDYELLTKKPLGNMLPVQAGRGCPKTCSFCSIACMYKGKYLARPVDEVIRDIEVVKSLGFNSFYLIDDNIVSDPEYMLSLCKKIEPLKMTWASQCALNLGRNKELVTAIVKSGGNLMSFGIESITQEGLNKLGKAWLNVNEHSQLISELNNAGIMVSAEMILGTDSDTEESIKATYDFIRKTKIPIPRLYILTPPPGSKLFDQYKSEGRLVTEDFEKYDGSQCVHKPEKISPEKLTELYWWLYRKLFTWKNILLRTIFNPAARKNPLQYLFAFGINLHYRSYIMKKVPPNIF